MLNVRKKVVINFPNVIFMFTDNFGIFSKNMKNISIL